MYTPPSLSQAVNCAVQRDLCAVVECDIYNITMDPITISLTLAVDNRFFRVSLSLCVCLVLTCFMAFLPLLPSLPPSLSPSLPPSLPLSLFLSLPPSHPPSLPHFSLHCSLVVVILNSLCMQHTVLWLTTSLQMNKT